MKKSVLFLTITMLAGCVGPGQLFEPRTYGVRDSEWVQLNTAERYAAKQAYLQEQALAEQHRTNQIMLARMQEANNSAHQRQNYPDAPSIQQHDYNIYQENLRREDARRQQNQIASEQQRIYDDLRQSTANTAQQHRTQEARAVEEARQRSLQTQRQDEERRRQLRAQEQRDLDEAIRRSMETYNTEQATRNQAQAGPNNWQPNEGQIVRAGELVMRLQRELGRQPSANEMRNKLNTSMGLNNEQSNKILDDLGLV
jgi:hypothetical protein